MEALASGQGNSDGDEAITGSIVSPGASAQDIPKPTIDGQVPKFQLMRWRDAFGMFVNSTTLVRLAVWMLWKSLLRAWIYAVVPWFILTFLAGVHVSYIDWVKIVYVAQAAVPFLFAVGIIVLQLLLALWAMTKRMPYRLMFEALVVFDLSKQPEYTKWKRRDVEDYVRRQRQLKDLSRRLVGALLAGLLGGSRRSGFRRFI